MTQGRPQNKVTLGGKEAGTIHHLLSLCKNLIKNQGGFKHAGEVMPEFSFDEEEAGAEDKRDAFL